MKTPVLLLCVLLAMCGVIVATFATEEAPTTRGVAHSKFKTMDEGGPPTRHDSRVLALGWAFGMLQIGVYLGCLAMAARRDGGRLIACLTISAIAYAGVFTGMTLLYVQSLLRAEPQFLGSFPVATSWMLFVLWPIPLLFVVCYVAGFRRWVWSEADRERFERILAARQAAAEVTD